MEKLEIFNDDEFQAQDLKLKKRYTDSYFNSEMVDDEFYKLDETTQEKYRQAFADTQIDETLKQKQIQENRPTVNTGVDFIDENLVNDFTLGSAKGLLDYGASAVKAVGEVGGYFGFDEFEAKSKVAQEKLNKASKRATKSIDNEYIAMAGEMIGDPINFTPAGIVSKGTKVARIAKSMGLGAVIGAGTSVAKDYGDDTITGKEQDENMILSAGIVSVINGAIAGITKGRVTNAIKDVADDFPDASSVDDIANGIMKNANEYELSADEADTVAKEIIQGGKKEEILPTQKLSEDGSVDIIPKETIQGVRFEDVGITLTPKVKANGIVEPLPKTKLDEAFEQDTKGWNKVAEDILGKSPEPKIDEGITPQIEPRIKEAPTPKINKTEMNDTDWKEANTLFSKGIDNLAVGTYAGIEQDENGNLSFDPEKFVLGLGGYTAVKAALKNKKVQGVLKEYAQKAIDTVDMNPAVYKENGINAMSPVKIGKNNDTAIDEVEKILDTDFKPYKHIEATEEAWTKEFGLKNVDDTAEIKNVFGETVNITPNQMKKMMNKSRGHYMGLVKSTIEEPTIVLKHNDAEVYITRFYDENKKQYNLFAVSKDYNTGELTLSSVVHRRTSQIRNKILEGEVTYLNHGTVDGVSSSRATSPSSNTNPHETIIPQLNTNLKANGMHSMAGGFAGGSDSLINQRDYDGDGEYNYKDLLAGVVAGTISINALKKVAPKLFQEEVSKGTKIGAFGGDAQKTNKSIDSKGNILDKAINKGVKTVAKTVDNISGNHISKAYNTVKETKLADNIIGHKIYEKKDYMKWRDDAFRERSQRGADLEKLHKQLAEFPTDTKVKLYDYMSGDKNVELSDTLKKLGEKFIKEIDDKGVELVDEGILSQEALDVWKGAYLKRRYASKMASVKTAFESAKGKTINPVVARGKMWTGTEAQYKKYLANNEIGKFRNYKIEATEIPGGKYQFRRDWTPQERKNMGEIKDASFSIPDTLSHLDEMVAHAKLLRRVAGKYVLSSQDIEKFTPMQIKQAGYEKLTGEKYGALNGQYVENSVATDIKELNTQVNGVDGSVQNAIAEYMKWYKSIHTIYNPKTHFNNIMSNLVGFAFMEGRASKTFKTVGKEVGKAFFPTAITSKGKADALIELEARHSVGRATKEEIANMVELQGDKDVGLWMEARRNGLFGKDQLNDVLNTYMKPSVKKVDTLAGKIHQKAGDVYQFEDDIVRFALFKQLKDEGHDSINAIREVGKILPDYSKPMSLVANFLRRYGIAPFIAFPYYSTPIMMRQIAERPTRPMAMAAMIYGLYQANGIDMFDDREVPERFKKSFAPFMKIGDKVFGFKYDRWLPHIDLLKLHKILIDTFWSNNPYVTLGGAMKGLADDDGGYSPYFGGKITYNKGLEGKADIVKTLLTGFVTPDILDGAGSLILSLIKDEEDRKTNKVYNPKNTAQSVLNILGLNTTSFNRSAQKRKYDQEKKD